MYAPPHGSTHCMLKPTLHIMCNGYVTKILFHSYFYSITTPIYFLSHRQAFNQVLNLATWFSSALVSPFTIWRCLYSWPPLISLSPIRLPHFLVALTSLKQQFLSFPVRSHRSPHYWLKMSFSCRRRPFIPISICNLIIIFKFIRYCCNKKSSTLLCTTPSLHIHWLCSIYIYISIKWLYQFIHFFVYVPLLI